MSAVEERKPDDSTRQASADLEAQQRKVYGNNASADFLNELKGQSVVVVQSAGIEYRGTLHAVDGFLNVVLRNTKEVYENTVLSELGEVFLRGSSVEYIAAA